MTDLSTDTWACPDCTHVNKDYICCIVCNMPRPGALLPLSSSNKGRCSALVVNKNHPTAIVARGCGTGRPPKQPPLPTCESPHRNTKEKVIESMKPQLRLPKDPVAAVPTVARAGTGVANLAGNDSNGEEEEEGSPHCPYPARVSGGKTMGL